MGFMRATAGGPTFFRAAVGSASQQASGAAARLGRVALSGYFLFFFLEIPNIIRYADVVW